MSLQNCCPDPNAGNHCFKEAVCIDTQRIYDSCCDKECIEDLQVHFFGEDQEIIDHAMLVKAKKIEVVHTHIEVEPVPFDKGFFSVDITYFFKVTLAVYSCPTGVPTTVHGLATFSKKVILYGSEGSVRTFSSDGSSEASTGLPLATVQVVDPLVLACNLEDFPKHNHNHCCKPCHSFVEPPACVAAHFHGCVDVSCAPRKIVTITIGIFSIIQLQRRVQLLIPAYDFCIPSKDCTSASNSSDPCEIFEKIKFPTDEFFPPKLVQ